MSNLVAYELEHPICTITLDDGKVNCLSLQMLAEINAALDRAEKDRAAVVLTGREGKFSAGFDLAALGKGSGSRADETRAPRARRSPSPRAAGRRPRPRARKAHRATSTHRAVRVSSALDPLPFQPRAVAIVRTSGTVLTTSYPVQRYSEKGG